METQTHLREARVHTEYGKREREFGGEFNDARALRAFRSYRKLCKDAPSQKMSVAEQMYGERFDTRYVIKDGKVCKAEAPDITDQEVPFICESYEEAVSRVMELVGPIPTEQRKFQKARFDNNILKAVEYCGFLAHLETGVRTGTEVSWRLDYDPEKKSHFNVLINPPKNGIDVNPLNIAFIFPYYEDKFLDIAEATCRQVVQPEDTTKYLPRTMGDVERIANLKLV